MGQQDHFKSIGAADAGASAEPAGLRVAIAHGDVVKEALSGPLRGLIVLVMAANLALGIWLISGSDISALRSNAAGPAAQAESPQAIREHREPQSRPLQDGSDLATAMNSDQ